MASKKFTLKVINQDGILYYGTPDVLFVPGQHDVIAVMAYHTPMIMRLGHGNVSVREGHTTKKLTDIKSGIIYVGDNDVSVLVN